MENIPNTTVQKPKGGAGAMIAIVVIILLVVVGGLYFWGQKLITSTTPAQEEQTLPVASTSDEVGAIDEDLNADLDGAVNIDLTDLEATLK